MLRRLASLGYAPDEESLTAPWTRQQCVMLVEEAEDIASRRSTKLTAGAMNAQALQMIAALKTEFRRDAEKNAVIGVESIYARYLHIAGSPLRDSYHFGQTLTNDYGRPYGNGANAISGFSAYGTWGRFSAYFRGENQDAAGRGSYDERTRSFMASVDQVPIQLPVGLPPTRRFDPVEMYVGVQLGNFDVTVGKQSLWWGADESSAFHFSNNAEPFYALKLAQARPILLPGPLRVLGRIRTQLLFGELSGHQYPPRPFINAQKITLQVTQNLELGFTRSAIFGGVGHPLTAQSFFQSLFSVSSSRFERSDPGDRRSGFDFRWRVPKLRRYVTIYSDSLADDEPNPLANPRRSAWAPGVYITQLPKLRHLDLRFETYSTWLYRKDEGGGFFYWNNNYHDAYTNDGNLLGSWVGRDARAYAASSTYWWSGSNKITASFRQVKTGSNFLPGGGTQTDASLTAQWQLRPGLLATAFGQYERYFVPVLGSPQRDIVAGLQFVYYPRNWAVRK
ncbi:MAG: capsule assembly Wzi family protein [Acidobacteriaceae bacterium]|nr:capsule assembly Wzi family protein [Acidobacteriaceae bacterium]